MNFNLKKPGQFRILVRCLIGFLLIAFLLAGSFLDQEDPSFYQINFFDVGQGDAAMIRTPSGRIVMIDCGTDLDSDRLISALYAERVKEIDCLIFSHAHDDHMGGAYALITHFEVKKILKGDYPLEGVLGNKIRMAANCPIENVGTGYEIQIGADAKITVLAPDHAKEGGDNNDSLILLLTIGMRRFIFTGDLEQDGEEQLLQSYPNGEISADVLKVGHHGSNTSSSEAFLDSVRPQIAIISVAKDNSYGHPAFETLDRLNARGIRILRTDQMGTIRLRCDGNHIYLKE